MVRKLLKSVREYKKHSILAPIFVIFEVIMEVDNTTSYAESDRFRHRMMAILNIS